jgi:hypothetical protein
MNYGHIGFVLQVNRELVGQRECKLIVDAYDPNKPRSQSVRLSAFEPVALDELKESVWISYTIDPEDHHQRRCIDVQIAPPSKLGFSQAQSGDAVRVGLNGVVAAGRAANVPTPPSLTGAATAELAVAVFDKLQALRRRFVMHGDHLPVPDFVMIEHTIPAQYQEFFQAVVTILPD